MNITGWIIISLLILLFLFFGVGSVIINLEKKKADKKINKIKEEAVESAKHTAKTIEEANKDKSEVRTGDHNHDLYTMASKLRKWANKQ